jgi:signal transduction histidine kinase
MSLQMVTGLKSILAVLIRKQQSHDESEEYQTWRQQFLLERLKIALWIAVPAAIALTVNGVIVVFVDSQQFEQDMLRIYEDASLIPRMRSQISVNIGIQFAVLLSCWRLRYSPWGKQHPRAIFLLLSSMLTWLDMVVGTVFGIPVPPDPSFFLAQAVLMPVYWRLHLISQLVPILHYAAVYPVLGLTKIGKVDFYNYYSIERAIELIWIGIICISSVYLYEKLKRSEFESQRQLRNIIHAISHDLKTPVMGISVLLQGLLHKNGHQLSIDRTILEQLLAGSERQIHLIKSLIEASSAEIGTLILHCQPAQLSILLDEVINDLEPIALQHRITITQNISAELSLVFIDKTQIWRVFNNLIANAIKHNPHGTKIEITIKQIIDRDRQWIHCSVCDNGVGIPTDQLPHLFKLYSRGQKSRRMPGLGLGLFLCQQIINAHHGDIGVNSQLASGSVFWFTLPVHDPRS